MNMNFKCKNLKVTCSYFKVLENDHRLKFLFFK